MIFQPTHKWHEGPTWTKFFKIYDEIASSQFTSYENGESRIISTSYGDTQVHLRGNSQNPPICFFHGISSCSLMFGEWLIPRLASSGYYCIAIDTIGDLGRSCPKDNNPKNGPKTEEEFGDWALQIFQSLNLVKRVHLIGYSMGSFLASVIAQHVPKDTIGKIILLAPAGLLSPVRKMWLLQAIIFAILSKATPTKFLPQLQLWFFGSMMANPKESMKNLKYPELRQASDEIGMAQVQIQPYEMDTQVLREMNLRNPTMLVMGRQESVIDASKGIEKAKDASFSKVVVYEDAGHMFFCEHPREVVIDEIIDFLGV